MIKACLGPTIHGSLAKVLFMVSLKDCLANCSCQCCQLTLSNTRTPREANGSFVDFLFFLTFSSMLNQFFCCVQLIINKSLCSIQTPGSETQRWDECQRICRDPLKPLNRINWGRDYRELLSRSPSHPNMQIVKRNRITKELQNKRANKVGRTGCVRCHGSQKKMLVPKSYVVLEVCEI